MIFLKKLFTSGKKKKKNDRKGFMQHTTWYKQRSWFSEGMPIDDGFLYIVVSE